MARRLLGADNAATVLNTQDTEEEPVTQVRQLFIRIHTHWREEHAQTWNHTGMKPFYQHIYTGTNPPAACIPHMHLSVCPLILRWCHSYLMITGFPPPQATVNTAECTLWKQGVNTAKSSRALHKKLCLCKLLEPSVAANMLFKGSLRHQIVTLEKQKRSTTSPQSWLWISKTKKEKSKP